MKTQILSLLLLAWFSAACQPATTVVVPTATATLTPPPTYTATVRPSPTVTVTPTLEPTATPCPPLPTPEASQFSEPRFAKSPDGVWAMKFTSVGPIGTNCLGPGEAVYERITVSNGKVEWALIDQWEGYGLGSGYYAPFHWSDDGERLYFTYAAKPDGCAGLNSQTGLWQVSLVNGEVTQILEQIGFVLGLSPDESQLVYIRFGSKKPTILDLPTQTEISVPLPEAITTSGSAYDVGQAVWSPDKTSVLLNVWRDFCTSQLPPENTAVIRIELLTGKAEIVLENITQGFMAQAWPELDKVQVRDKTGVDWWLNPETGVLTQP